ncbi:ribonucleoprotein p18, mitochondrial precursor, putative [Leishmania tarentolae]|uniref:Ribonucleoprotein p18, mitochondrial, putative n=1 Tax=Leishmania tarentolae TaxID=5689 RepID=A0A640KCB8_LEITA|nr:ribonucleoprotein p18, mitochondrial precursor, putative [Leishmania tarentolae]
MRERDEGRRITETIHRYPPHTHTHTHTSAHFCNPMAMALSYFLPTNSPSLPQPRYSLLNLDVEQTLLLRQRTRVLLAVRLRLCGVRLVLLHEVLRHALELSLHQLRNAVAEAELPALHALFHHPRPRLLVRLHLVTVLHLLHQVHHRAELALVLHRLFLLARRFEDLLQRRVVRLQVRRAVLHVHAHQHLAGLVVVAALLHLFDPRRRVRVHLVAEQVVLLRATGGREADRGSGAHQLARETAHA